MASVKYTDKQLQILKGIIEYSESFASVMLETIKKAGLDKVEGCRLAVTINPDNDFVTRFVSFGEDVNYDSGHITMVKGKDDKQYVPSGSSTPEYVFLLAPNEIRARMREILSASAVTPDSIWMRSDYDPDSLDSGVSVNG